MFNSQEGYLWTPQGTLEGLPTASVISSSAPTKESYDAIIIGTGFAGLIAARDLCQQARANVLLIEPRDRIGGRTWTADVDGEQLEMGGTWVHWNQPHLYSELHRYSLHRNLKTSSGTAAAQVQYYKAADSPIQNLSVKEAADICERVASEFFQIDGLGSRTLMPYPHDPFREPAPWRKFDRLSIKDRLDQLEDIPQIEKDIFETMTSSFGSAPAEETAFCEALRWYALGGHNMGQVFELAGVYKLGNGGMTSLARCILADFSGDVLMSSPVTKISQDVSGAVVTTKQGRQFHAKVVITTIPLNCLGDVTFEPALGQLRKEAIAHGHINKGAKIHFKLSQVEQGWFATCYKSSPYVFAFSDHNGAKSHCPDGTWCIGFGYNGHLEDKRDNKAIIEQFKNNIRPDADIKLYATHDWMNDPYAKGAWSCWGPCSMTKYWQELQKPHGRVIFASADWADGWRGFVDGAIEMGHKAARDAREIIQAGETVASRL